MLVPLSLTDLGALLQSAAASLNNRVQSNINSLDFHQIQQMTNAAQDLLIKAKALSALATIQLEDTAQDAVKSLTTANTEINKAITTVGDIQKAVDIAGDLVGIGASILSQSWGSIPGYAQSALTDVKAITGGGGDA